MAIMRENPNIAKRLEQGTTEVRENKKNLMSNAAEYREIYRKEIEEGTKKRILLLEDGRRRGLSEEDVLRKHGKFIPSDQTPIMNFIYFLMRDGEHPDWMGIHRDLKKTYGHNDEKLNSAISEEDLDRILGCLIHEDEKYINVKNPEDMDKMIYGNLSHDLFMKVKKLKTLAANSMNEHEALVARKLCLRLCEKFDLDFSKIPVYVEET